MAYSTIIKPSDYFNTKLYTGNGSTNAITGVGFQPDWTWVKGSTLDQCWFDSVRGVTKRLRSNTSNAEDTTSGVTAFGTDGFTLGSSAEENQNSTTFTSWNWKAGTTSGITTDGSSNITPSGYSFNTTSKFSVVKWAGTGVDGAYLPHGLGVAPSVAIIKKTSASEEWVMFHIGLGSNARQEYLRLNNTAAKVTTSGIWYSQLPTATNIRLSNDSWVNASGSNYVGYFFADTPGYQKHDSYLGNGNAEGTFTYTGFKPAWVLIKNAGETQNWILLDNKRDVSPNPHKLSLFPNTTDVEAGDYNTDFLSNGFKIRSNTGQINNNIISYVYMAFAQNPFTANVDGGLPVTAV